MSLLAENMGNTDAINERFENLEKVQYITPNASSFTYPFNTDSEVDGIIRNTPDDGGINWWGSYHKAKPLVLSKCFLN